MQLLTLDDQTFLMDRVPDKVDEDMRFAVLDNSDIANPDFFFVPLIYLESFSSPSAAAAIFLARNANGRTERKDSTGKTLKEIQEAIFK